MLYQFLSQVTPKSSEEWGWLVAIVSIVSAATVKIFLSLSSAIRQLAAEWKSYKESQRQDANRLIAVTSMVLMRSLGDNELAKKEVNEVISDPKEKPKQGG